MDSAETRERSGDKLSKHENDWVNVLVGVV